MTMAIERYDEYDGSAIRAHQPQSLGEMVVTFGNLASQIAKTEFVPDAFRNKPETVLACMLFGQEVGLGPMASLNLVQSIKGSVGLKPEGMRALVKSHGHSIWTEEYTDEAVTLCGQRKGSEHIERVTWTMADAKKADLAGKDIWKKYPRAMLLARATSELCRLHFSDVTGGLAYGGDELEEFTPPRASISSGYKPVQAVDPETGEVHDVNPETGQVKAPAAPPPKVATKRPPPAKAPTIKEMVADPTVKLLVDDLNAIENEEARVAAKEEFVARFKCTPADLKPEQYEEAAAYVASVCAPF